MQTATFNNAPAASRVWQVNHFYREVPSWLRGAGQHGQRRYAPSVAFHAAEGRAWAVRRLVEAQAL